MSALFAGLVGLALTFWILAFVSYRKMMGGLPPQVAKLHCARLGVRAGLLAFSSPEIFEGKAARYRRWYVGSLLSFAAFFAAAGIANAFLPS